MNRRIETALRSKYNFRKRCSAKETNELCAQGYNNFIMYNRVSGRVHNIQCVYNMKHSHVKMGQHRHCVINALNKLCVENYFKRYVNKLFEIPRRHIVVVINRLILCV